MQVTDVTGCLDTEVTLAVLISGALKCKIVPSEALIHVPFSISKTIHCIAVGEMKHIHVHVQVFCLIEQQCEGILVSDLVSGHSGILISILNVINVLVP